MFLARRTYLLTCRALRTIAVVAAVALASSATAQSQAAVEFDIPAQPLELSLRQIADAQKLQLVYTRPDLNGVKASAVKGRYTAAEAVSKATEGTGLVATFTRSDTVVIKPKPADEKGGQAANPTLLAQAPSAERRGTSDPQDQSTASGRAVQLEGIIVTATKREERLIDVPSSIAVVTKDDIDRRGLVNAEDYLRGIPGANQMQSPYGQSIVIRGIETSPHLQNNFSGATTATYFGETPTTYTAGIYGGTNVDLKLVDIERVEILRGPQGTAFGSSSMGGTVRTIPVAPNLDRWEGKFGGSYSITSGTGGDNYNAQAVVNIPLVKDGFAIRGVAYKYYDSGFYRNVAGSDARLQAVVARPYGVEAFATNEDDVGAYYATGGRIAALFRPLSALSLTVSYLSQTTETDGIATASSGTYEQSVLQVAPEHVVRGQKGGASDTKINIANAMIQYDLGWADVLATYSYVKSESVQSYPYGAIAVNWYNWPVSNRSDSDHRENVGEIRLVTQLRGPWNFLGGLYFEELKDGSGSDNVWYGTPATNFLAPGERALGSLDERRNLKQKAAFGEAYWNLLPDLTLTGGVRAYEYTRRTQRDGLGPFFGGAAGTHTERQAEASGETLRANLSYKAGEDKLLYAGWSQGFRLGQAQIGLPPGLCDRDGDGFVDGTSITIESTTRVNSDNVDSYELGGKFVFFDRRLLIAADVFRMKWSDVPVQVRPGTGACLGGYVANAGEAVSDGVEFQANFNITPAFRVDFGGSWIDAKLTKDAPAIGAFKGNRLPGAPKTNGNLGVQYAFEFGGYKAFVRADSIYVGSFYGNLQQSPNTKSAGYMKLDVSARLTLRKDLNFDFFVRNITNEDAFTFRGPYAIPPNPTGPTDFYGYRLRPRTIGVQLAYVF